VTLVDCARWRLSHAERPAIRGEPQNDLKGDTQLGASSRILSPWALPLPRSTRRDAQGWDERVSWRIAVGTVRRQGRTVAVPRGAGLASPARGLSCEAPRWILGTDCRVAWIPPPLGPRSLLAWDRGTPDGRCVSMHAACAALTLGSGGSRIGRDRLIVLLRSGPRG
jgi:hypothetical protein